MAEKEERITIHEVAYPCKKCSINCNKNDWKDCDFYQNYISGMTRQEAIDIIAKALCADDVMREGYYQLAEAALNALLGE